MAKTYPQALTALTQHPPLRRRKGWLPIRNDNCNTVGKVQVEGTFPPSYFP